MRISLFSFLIFLSYPAYAELNNSSLLPKALSGDVCAQGKIGYYYQYSQGGLKKDYQKAIEWYEKAANTECADEHCKQCKVDIYRSLAIVYKSHLSPNDEKKAFYWFKKAAENDNASVYRNMAEYYVEGKFVEQDYEQAYYWITRGKRKNVRTEHDELITEIQSHLTQDQIRKIDDQNQRFFEELVQKQKDKSANMKEKSTMGFNPNIPPEHKANARLAFEIVTNKFHYDLQGIKKLIDQGALKGPRPSNAFLFEAQKNDDLELIKLLISNGANVNGVDENGSNVLHHAIAYGQTDIALTLIEAGISLEDSNDLGETPLMAAASQGNLEVVNALIKSGANVHFVNKGNYGSRDALYLALKGGYNQVAKTLIEAGAVKGEIHNKYSYDPTAPRKCAHDKKTCPNGQRISRSGPQCKFEACSIVKNEKTEEKNVTIKQIKDNPENYNPLVLNELSQTLFSRIEDQDAAFWYMAAWLRGMHDMLICKDKTSKNKIQSNPFVQQFRPYVMNNKAIIKDLLPKVLEWDRTTPYNYDLRWVNIENGNTNNELTDSIPENPCVPDNVREELREKNRRKYESDTIKFLESFD